MTARMTARMSAGMAAPALEVLPSIDLRGGRVVDLFQGDYARETVYAETAEGVAARFVGDGTRWIHCVDLAGSRDGAPANREAVARIAGVSVQAARVRRAISGKRTESFTDAVARVLEELHPD